MPDPRDTPATGAWKFLSPLPALQAVVGAFPSNDPVAGNAGKSWIFSGNMLAQVKGSSATAVVLGDAGGWGVAPMLGTQRFMRLRVELWTDPQRDANGNIIVTSENTKARQLDVFKAFHFYLQRTDADIQVWGNLVTNSCQLLTEPDPQQMPDGDSAGMGAMLGTAIYGVEVVGWTI